MSESEPEEERKKYVSHDIWKYSFYNCFFSIITSLFAVVWFPCAFQSNAYAIVSSFVIWLYSFGLDLNLLVLNLIYGVSEETFYEWNFPFFGKPQYKGDNFWFVAPFAVLWNFILWILAFEGTANAHYFVSKIGRCVYTIVVYIPLVICTMLNYYFFCIGLPGLYHQFV